MQMANTHRKRCSTSLSFRRMQTKTIMRYHLTFIRTALIKKNTSNKCWLGCSGKGTLLHCCVYAQSCPNLCDPVNCSPPGSSVHGIFQVRVVEWVSISSSRGSSHPRNRTQVSCIACRFLTTEPPGKPSYTVGGNVPRHSHYGRLHGVFSKN